MAKATVERRQTEKTIIVTTDEPVYVVEMTQDEAQAVRDVLGDLMGCITDSRRRFTDLVYDALGEAGIPIRTKRDIEGTVRFTS